MTALLEALRLRPRRPHVMTLAVGLVSSVALVVMFARGRGSDAEPLDDTVLAEPPGLPPESTSTQSTSVGSSTSAESTGSMTDPGDDRAEQQRPDDEPTRKEPARPPTTCKFTLPTAMGSELSSRGPERPPCARLRSQVTVLGSTERAVRLRVQGAGLELQPGRPRTTRKPRACWLVSGALEASYLALSVELDSTKCSG